VCPYFIFKLCKQFRAIINVVLLVGAFINFEIFLIIFGFFKLFNYFFGYYCSTILNEHEFFLFLFVKFSQFLYLNYSFKSFPSFFSYTSNQTWPKDLERFEWNFKSFSPLKNIQKSYKKNIVTLFFSQAP
jgi:hypothetical protein